MMRVSSLFSDYDGTLARDDIPPEGSGVAEGLERVLRRIALRIPLVIVTSKDSSFIRRRIPYTRAWGCAAGLELVYPEGPTLLCIPSTQTESCLETVRGALKSARLEEKRSLSGDLLGFSIDWRGGKRPEGLDGILDDLRRPGTFALEDPTRPYVDVYAARPDKGRALRLMRDRLGAKGPAMYLGDSSSDDPAFCEADLGIGVYHGQGTAGLACDFWVDQGRLKTFLASLEARDFEFDEELAGVPGRGGVGPC